MYQALYRKYRPQTFDEVVGQKSVTETLKAQLVSQKLSHAYLFTGSRGTGKTSCAKILAKAVNCENPVDGNPCNCCNACRRIDSGSCMDVMEIDAASNNGVDNIRTLRDDAIYAPAEVKKRVYIIDEVHMLSMSAFNALLKIIEEPPEHLLFILATTELHKVPATILSRCQRFSFRRLLPKDIAGRINYVAYQEGIDLTPEAANLLARLADGALRDGMSLLDQCATAVVNETVTAEKVYSCLGLAGAKQAAAILQAVAKRDTKTALTVFSEQYAAGKDIAAMLDELVSLCRDLLILRAAPQSGTGMLTGVCTDEEMKTLQPLFTSAELLRLTTLLQDTCSGFNRSANRRIDAELCFIQMCNPSLSMDAKALNARLSRVEETIASGNIAVQTAAEQPVKPQVQPQEEFTQAPAPTQQAPSEELPVGFWPEYFAKVRENLPFSDRYLIGTEEKTPTKAALSGNTLTLLAESQMVRDRLDKPEIRQIFTEKASAMLKKPVMVRIELASQNADTQDKLQRLVAFGKAHDDIINIKGE